MSYADLAIDLRREGQLVPSTHCPARRHPLAADKSKAAKAAKAVKKSQFKKTRKPRYSVVFHRPKTLVRSRDPKFPRTRRARGGARGSHAQAARACVLHRMLQHVRTLQGPLVTIALRAHRRRQHACAVLPPPPAARPAFRAWMSTL